MPDHNMNHFFTREDDSSGLLLAWWESLDRDRGARADLRRAASPSEVAFCPSFHRLLAQLRGKGYPLGREAAAALATVAGVVAHVKSNDGGVTIARQMATPKSAGGGARLSGLRFRRLLAVSGRDELFPLMIRVVRLLGGTVDLISLANAAFWWNVKTKKDWAYDYYATAPTEL